MTRYQEMLEEDFEREKEKERERLGHCTADW
jgi:hypothetical protein